jgi:hypothetical protein
VERAGGAGVRACTSLTRSVMPNCRRTLSYSCCLREARYTAQQEAEGEEEVVMVEEEEVVVVGEEEEGGGEEGEEEVVVVVVVDVVFFCVFFFFGGGGDRGLGDGSMTAEKSAHLFFSASSASRICMRRLSSCSTVTRHTSTVTRHTTTRTVQLAHLF